MDSAGTVGGGGVWLICLRHRRERSQSGESPTLEEREQELPHGGGRTVESQSAVSHVIKDPNTQTARRLWEKSQC